MPSPIAPAPTTVTRRPWMLPWCSTAISTAAWLTEAVPRAMPVSVRARLPTPIAWRNSRFSERAGATFALGDLPRLAELAEDLGLADDRRVEPGGDLEQVPHGGVVVLGVQVRVQLVGRDVAEIAQEVTDVGVRAVELLGDGVDLGAVAGAQHDDLADVVAPRQPGRPPWGPRRRAASHARAR